MAPSANQSGHVSPTTAKHVLDDLDGRIDMIIDGGPATVGVESTIVALLDRAAAASPRRRCRARTSSRCCGHDARRRAGDGRRGSEALIAPGMMASHYAPRAAAAPQRAPA